MSATGAPLSAVPAGDTDIVRPSKNWVVDFGLANFRLLAAIIRPLLPLVPLNGALIALRYDDTVEILGRGNVFQNDYQEALRLIMSGEPFILGLDDDAIHGAYVATMRAMTGAMPGATAVAAGSAALAAVTAAGGSVDVVPFVRAAGRMALCEALGLAARPEFDLWTQRLFEYQFVGTDPELDIEVEAIIPHLHAVIDAAVAARRGGAPGCDDVLGRAIALPGVTDRQIRTVIAGLLIAGLPQLPMAGPQALEQLLRRPAALAAAQAAAKAGDVATLWRLLREALRFDPLAPMIRRSATAPCTLAAGTRRARTLVAGAPVAASPFAAMHDPARIARSGRFDADRDASSYLHFGYGLHRCFGGGLVEAVLPALLMPLLAQPGLRRADGAAGRLVKRGPFAHSLHVCW